MTLAASLVCDLLISASLTYWLNRRTSRATRQTRAMIGKLILYSINIMVVTTILAAITVITYKVLPPTKFIWSIFFDNMGAIYVNSLLVSLNARGRLRRDLDPSTTRARSNMSMIFAHDAQGFGTDDFQLSTVSRPEP